MLKMSEIGEHLEFFFRSWDPFIHFCILGIAQKLYKFAQIYTNMMYQISTIEVRFSTKWHENNKNKVNWGPKKSKNELKFPLNIKLDCILYWHQKKLTLL